MIDVSYILAAPQERVFEYWVSADKLKQWWAPPGFRVGEIAVDAVDGGSWRIEMIGPPGTLVAVGTYSQVHPPDELQFSWAWERGDELSPESQVSVSFEFESPVQTRVRIRHTGLPTDAIEQHRAGWDAAAQQLIGVLNA